MPVYTVEKKRSITKAITFRVMVLTSDMIVIFFITHRVDLTVGLVLFTNLASTILYFFHERIWNKSQWGRTEMEETANIHLFKTPLSSDGA